MSPPRIPYPLGPFDLVSPAAEGATAMIWRAVHRERRVPVAIKIIHPPPIERRARMLRLFAHEVRSVARLDHPGIVRVHDFGTLPATRDPRLPSHAPYLVMEWIGGGTLADVLGRLDWPGLRATLLALLDALAHAHARGVVHQDLKAPNVLLSPRGPVLSDFGIACSVDHEVALESGPHFLGTPDYMAPEQILMERRAIGPWTDLYALGCLAYELVTGRPPFADRPRFEVLRAHLDAPIPRMPRPPDVPPGFVDWVHRLLDKDPTRRHRFAADAAAALRDLPGAPPALRVAPPTPGAGLPLPGTGTALFALRESAVVGRDAERGRLRALLAEVVADRRARVALLEGPTGLGKARLAVDLARHAHAEGLAEGLRATHSADHETGGIAGDGVGPMFARHLRCGGLDGADLLERLVARLGDEDTAWGVAAALVPGERFAIGGRAVLLGSAPERHEALCRALVRLTAERAYVLVIEDAQWAEDALRLVEHLLAHHGRLPVLVCATVCLDRVTPAARARLDALRSHPACARVPIGPMAPAELAASLRSRLPLEEGLLQRLVRRSAGSPVFAEELVRHWLRADALVQRAGGLGLRADARHAVPARLMDVWHARLAEALAPLGEDGRRALEAAAVLGGTIARRTWKRVADCSPGVLHAARERLLDARLAVGDAQGGWRFAHPMLGEVLLASAREAGRAADLHRRCALALMVSGADPTIIAEHHLAAGEPAEAVPLLFDAARRHRARRDHHAMRRDLLRLARALGALRRPRDAPARIELRILWAEACQGDDDLRRAWRHLVRAVAQAQARGDQRLVGWGLLTQAHLRMRERGVIERWLEPACAAAERAHDPELSWAAAHGLAFSLIKAGRFDEAEAALGPLARMLAGQADDIKRGDLLRLMALIGRGRGRYEEARASARQAAVLYGRSGSRLKQAHGKNLVGDLARYGGDLDEAAAAYREAVRFSELAGSYDALTDELNLGLVLLEQRRFGEARRILTAVIQRAERVRFRVVVIYAHLCLLVCEARDRRWRAWDLRWQSIGPIHAGRMVDVDVCRVAEQAAGLAAEAGRPRRAAAALRLAAAQYQKLGQPERAAVAHARAAAIEAAGGARG